MLDKWLKRKITEALETNEIVLCPEENRKEQKELFKMMDIIERVELYHSWCDPTTVGNVTKGMSFNDCLKALLLNGTTSISLNELMRGDRGKRHIIFFNFKFRTIHKVSRRPILCQIFHLQSSPRSSPFLSSNLQRETDIYQWPWK